MFEICELLWNGFNYYEILSYFYLNRILFVFIMNLVKDKKYEEFLCVKIN